MKFLAVIVLCLMVSLALGEHHFKKHHEKKHHEKKHHEKKHHHGDNRVDELNESKRLFGFGGPNRPFLRPPWARPGGPSCCPCQPSTTSTESTPRTGSPPTVITQTPTVRTTSAPRTGTPPTAITPTPTVPTTSAPTTAP